MVLRYVRTSVLGTFVLFASCVGKKTPIVLQAFLNFCGTDPVKPDPCGADGGHNYKLAMDMVKDGMNAANFLGADHELAIETVDTSCCADCAPKEFVKFLRSPRYAHTFGIVGTGCSGGASRLAPLADLGRLSMVSGSAIQRGLRDRTKFPYFWRTVTPVNSFRPMFLLAVSWGWKKVGVVWGYTGTWQSLWNDCKAIATELGITFQVGFQVTEERSAQLLTASDAVPVATVLMAARVRTMVALLFPGSAKLLICAQYLLGVRGMMIFGAPGWWPDAWGSSAVDLGDHGVRRGSVYRSVCPAEVMVIPPGSLFLNTMDWHPVPSTSLSQCGLSMTAGEFRAEHKRKSTAMGISVKQEAGNYADAVCMYGKALRELILNRGYTAATLTPLSENIFKELQTVLANLTWQGIAGPQEFGIAKEDLTKTGAGDRRGPLVIQQYFDGKVVDCKKVTYPYATDKDLSDLTAFRFVSGDGTTPPEATFPDCDERSVFNFTTSLCDPLVCDAGTAPGVSPLGTKMCLDCPPGRFSNPSEGDLRCTNCPAGRYGPTAARANCTICSAGHFCEIASMVETPCSPGYYNHLVGAAQCKACEVGRFANQTGRNICENCTRPMTTQLLAATGFSQCVCPEKMYLDLHGTCKACPDEMTCSANSTEAALMFAASGQQRAIGSGPLMAAVPGFYADYSLYPRKNPIEIVYKCMPKETCVGKDKCGAGRMGFLCAMCPDGSFLTKSSCKVCSLSGQNVWFPLSWPFLVVGLAIYLQLTKGPPREQATLLLAVISSVKCFVNVCQTFGVITTLSISFPVNVKSFMGASSWFTLDIRHALQVGCLYKGYARQYVLAAAMFLIIFLTLLFVGALLKFLSKFERRLATSNSQICNAFGNLCNLLLVPIVTLGATPMICYEHPNGVKSVLTSPSLICGSKEHSEVLVVGIALVLYATAVVAYSIFASYVAPRQQSEDMRSRAKYLFDDFRHDVYYWCPCIVTRQLLVSLTPVIFPDNSISQSIMFPCVLIVYTVVGIRLWPFKVPAINVVEFCISTNLALFAFISTMQENRPENSFHQAIVSLCTVLAFGPCLFILGVSIFLLVRRGQHSKAVSRLLALGMLPSSEDLAKEFMFVATHATEIEEENIAHRFDRFLTYDLRAVQTVIRLMYSYHFFEQSHEGMTAVTTNLNRLGVGHKTSVLITASQPMGAFQQLQNEQIENAQIESEQLEKEIGVAAPGVDDPISLFAVDVQLEEKDEDVAQLPESSELRGETAEASPRSNGDQRLPVHFGL